jgi:hypothetical protein
VCRRREVPEGGWEQGFSVNLAWPGSHAARLAGTLRAGTQLGITGIISRPWPGATCQVAADSRVLAAGGPARALGGARMFRLPAPAAVEMLRTLATAADAPGPAVAKGWNGSRSWTCSTPSAPEVRPGRQASNGGAAGLMTASLSGMVSPTALMDRLTSRLGGQPVRLISRPGDDRLVATGASIRRAPSRRASGRAGRWSSRSPCGSWYP